jgi:hypothetical protein
MNLTAKDLRAIELFQKYEQGSLLANLEEYHSFIDTLIFLHEAISEEKVQVKYWQKLSETLLHKFSFHGLTIHNILSGLELHSNYYKEMSGKKITDIASAKVVLRSQIEAFLMYHYIYVNPDSDDLKELRYNAWIYSGLLQRQEFPAETEYGKQQKEKDSLEIEKMRSAIINLKSFKELTSKQQQSLLSSGSGKLFNHWSNIIKETFTENSRFHLIYNHLSMYSHSEGISIIQLEYQPNLDKNMINQANLDLHHSKLLVCLMITSIMNLFKVARDRFEKLPDNIRYDIELYNEIAKAT